MAEPELIASIKADIQAAIARIEHELGAHPAFTWAQTSLKQARVHLEGYANGSWREQDQALVRDLVTDERGFVVDRIIPKGL